MFAPVRVSGIQEKMELPDLSTLSAAILLQVQVRPLPTSKCCGKRKTGVERAADAFPDEVSSRIEIVGSIGAPQSRGPGKAAEFSGTPTG